jgi:hypothetical protein
MPSDPRVHVEINVVTDGCPCGHPLNDAYRCLNGRIYGPCSSEDCDGVCDDTWGTCQGDCRCEREAEINAS